jgi:hypothetical protein
MDHIKIEDNIVKTPVVSYSNGKSLVTFVGTIHFGSERYYQDLQKIIDKISNGLYECIRPIDETKVNPDRKKFIPKVRVVESLQRVVAKILGLSYQNVLSYNSWTNADIDGATALNNTEIINLEKFDGSGAEVLQYFYDTSPLLAKEILYEHISSRMKAGTINDPKLFGQNVIYEIRERVLFDHLDEKLKTPNGEIGICYGCAHFNGINQGLESRGFSQKGLEWVSAFELQKMGIPCAPAVLPT